MVWGVAFVDVRPAIRLLARLDSSAAEVADVPVGPTRGTQIAGARQRAGRGARHRATGAKATFQAKPVS